MTQSGHAARPAWRNRGLLILLAAFACLATVYSVVTPLFEAPDELFHYPFVKHLADGHGLPVQDPANPGPWEQEGSQPPLYYALAAAVSRWVPSDDLWELLPRNPHADIGLVRPDGNINQVIHSPREGFPYRGAALAIHLVRLFSVGLGVVTVLFAYLLGVELAPHRPALALAGAAVVAFTPMFLFITGTVNNDNLLVALSTASVWLILRLVRRETSDVLRVPCSVLCRRGPAPAPGEAPQPAQHACPHLAEDTQYAIRNTEHATRNTQHASRLTFDVSRLTSDVPYAGWLLLGAVIGLAALSKVSGLALLPLAGLGLAWVAWRRRDWRVFFWGGVCVVGAATLVAGWWYYRNWRLYGDPLGWNVMIAIARPRPVPPSLLDLWGEREGFIKSYWGLFGAFSVTAPGWFYRLLNGTALLGATGLLLELGRRVWQRRWPGFDVAFRGALLAAWPLLLLAGLVRWTRLTMASQGRLVFPAIAVLSWLMVVGFDRGAWCVVRVLRCVLRIAYSVLRPNRVAAQNAAGRKLPASAQSDGPRNMQHATRSAPCATGNTEYAIRNTERAPLLVAAMMALLSAWIPFGVIAPAYARPPLLTDQELASVPERLDVSFDGQMALVGYQIGAREARPGGEVAVTLYWQAQAPMAEDYSVFVHLLDENGRLVAQRDMYPGRGLFPTTQWQPGDAIADTYILRVPASLGRVTRLRVEAGLYRLAGYRRLPVRDGRGRALGDHVGLGEVVVRPRACDRITNPVRFTLGDRIALVGYDLDRTALRPGETLHLTLFWQALAPVEQSYTVFTHVLGPGNNLWAQDDGLPLEGTRPTNAWPVGEVICDTYELTLKPETPAGAYEVEIGMYLRETLQRLEAVGPQGRLPDDRIVLGRIRVDR